MKHAKRRVFFRVFSGNRLTMPLLLNIWESNGIDRLFEIRLLDADPGTLSETHFSGIRAGDVVIFSFMTPHLPWVAAEAGRLRSLAGSRPLLAAGGPHASAEPESVAACGFDFVFSGPGEETFLRFGQDLLSGATGGGPRHYDGIVPGRDPRDRESLWQGYIPVSAYFKTVPPLEITRGCFWNCRYCQTGGERPSYRDTAAIRHYLAELKRRRLRRVGFISPSALEYGADGPLQANVAGIETLLGLCRDAGLDHIEYGIFPSEIRPDTAARFDLSRLRRRVSNRRLTFGAQSAADERLAAIGRGHRVADIIDAVRAANDAGFAANLDFIIALPGESADDRRGLLDLLGMLRKKFRVFFQLHHFFPLAGSPFARRLPSFLNDRERETFFELKKNGLASDWWREGEKSVKAYLDWLKKKSPSVFGEYD
jgi:radical SAM superfamily enzyme YgiQ (UPF0313 family)